MTDDYKNQTTMEETLATQTIQDCQVDLNVLTVQIKIYNNTNQVLTKTKDSEKNKYDLDFPDKMDAYSEVNLSLRKEGKDKKIDLSVCYKNEYGTVEIIIQKTANPFESSISAIATNDLIDDVVLLKNSKFELNAKVIIAESLVTVTMRNVYHFLNELKGHIDGDRIEMGGGNLFDMINYAKACQIFNTRLQLRPFAIIYCTSTEEVQRVYKGAIHNNLAIRVRSGGHDHEGECSGTDTILIDLSRMNTVDVDSESGIATIGPGNRFERLTTLLAEKQVMIPHGTCATVGIAGFTFGGGWGPWTRSKGMCCERLVGATMVLGDGSIKELSEDGDSEARELLWALKGGGGFSYGIVTELKLQTFELPRELIRFEIEWNKYETDSDAKQLKIAHKDTVPTLQFLKEWEEVINVNRKGESNVNQLSPNEKLIGTNLKISAIPAIENFDANTVVHNCVMYGYWDGNEKELSKFIEKNFKNPQTYDFRITDSAGKKSNKAYGSNMMSNWDRESFHAVKQLLKGGQDKSSKSRPIAPDLENPAPHKITSCLVDPQGLGAKGHEALLRSLTSPLILYGNRELGLFTYITLGAISGVFYQSKAEELESAFPYKDKQYTIQYQTWWNEALERKEEGQNNFVYDRINRALDWMQVCRDFNIPNTSGAFISFKDSSIPTATYFDSSYERLKEIKKKYSKDSLNHFRTRKTII
jgi:hypothetical protein